MKHTPMKALVSTALVLVLGSPLAVERVHAAAIPDEAGIMATELLAEQASGDIVVVTETDGVPSFKVVKNIDSVSEAETAIEGAVQATGPGTVLTDADWQETATLTAAVTGPLTQWPVTTLGLEQAWSASTGSGVVVAVVDSGVAAHPDIPNLLPGFTTVGGTVTAGQTDSLGHGTYVAGIIGAGNDGIGITGVAHGASILPIKAFAGSSAPVSDVAAGIVKAVEAGAHVISMGFGFASENAALTAAIDFAVERGVVLVAASGNEAATSARWPAADPRVLAVGAIQENGTLWSLSNTGSELDLVAPGRNVISTVVASSAFRGWGGITDGTFSYGYASGTSMATPHVAGVAALVLARHPEATRAQVMSFLTSTASDKGDTGFDASYGYGLVNPTAALAASDTVYGTPPSAPGAPTSIVTDAGNSSIRLTWNAPVNDGGATITDYEIKYSSNSGSSWTPFPHDASNMTNATVTGLVNGTGYSFRVSAVNTTGTGSPSNVTPTVTPIAAPGAPSGLSATAGRNSVRLTWNAADANGSPVTDYVIEYSSNSGASWTVFTDGVSNATNATVTGLTSGTRYIFRVSAVNAAGQGSAGATTDEAAASPFDLPGAPSALALTPGNRQVRLAWVAPATDGGSAITDYTIEYSRNTGLTWEMFSDGVSTETSAVVSGLPVGDGYLFRVAALNAAGASPAYATVAGVIQALGDVTLLTPSLSEWITGRTLVSFRIGDLDQRAFLSISNAQGKQIAVLYLTPRNVQTVGTTLDAYALGDGTLTVRVVSFSGEILNVTRIALRVDAQAPSLSVGVFGSAGRLRGLVEVPVNAADNQSLSSVGVYSRGALLATSTSAPWSPLLDTELLQDGPVDLEFVATDEAGNQRKVRRSFQVDNTVPSIDWIPNNIPATNTVSFPFTASDADRVAAVELLVNGRSVKTVAASARSIVWSRPDTERIYTLQLRATDAAGNVGWSSTRTAPGIFPVFPPTVAVTSVGAASARLIWAVPRVTKEPVTRYRILTAAKAVEAGLLTSAPTLPGLTTALELDVTLNAPASAYTLTGLAAETPYALYVFACSVRICSSAIPAVFTTPPLPAHSLKASVEPGGRVVVTWVSGNAGKASLEHLYYRKRTDSQWLEWSPNTPDNSPTTLTGLTSTDTYVVKVATVGASGRSDSAWLGNIRP